MYCVKLPEGFSIEALSEETIEEAIRLCDKHVGEGLYESSFFRRLPEMNNHHFFLIAQDGSYVGYFYCLWIPSISEMPDLDVLPVRELISPEKPIGVCRSIGIDEKYRGLGLSDALLGFFTEFLFNRGCGAVLVPAWKKGDYIPAKRHLEASGFRRLCDLHEPWKNNTSLCCPFCRSTPCICDAVIYYKLEVEHETT